MADTFHTPDGRPRYRFLSEDRGFCRVYYRGPNRALRCIQDEGRNHNPRYVFYSCSSDGEPSWPVKMPDEDQFDKLVMP